MFEIISAQNRKFKLWAKLLHRKYRDRELAYLIEGKTLIADASDAGADIREIIFCGSGVSPAEELGACLARSLDKVPQYALSPELYSNLTQTENGRSVMALVTRTDYGIEDITGRRGAGLLILDRLQDPGNIGTIIRTADAAGMSGIIALKGTADIYSPKVVRAAAGSLFRMPVAFADSPGEAADAVRAAGLKLVASGFDTDVTVFDADFRGGAAVIIGNEGGGISPELMKTSDIIVTIPMSGHTDSLNASVAAGIIMYECVRQNTYSERG